MSHPAICAGVASWPRFGVSTMRLAPAQPPTTSASATQTRSRVDMLHLAVGRHAPGLDAVEVEDRVVAMIGDERIALRLHGPRIVGGARFQHARAPVPLPRHTEARERAR